MRQKKWWINRIHGLQKFLVTVLYVLWCRVVKNECSHRAGEEPGVKGLIPAFPLTNSMVLGKLVNFSGLLREDCPFGICIWYIQNVSDTQATFYFCSLTWEWKHSHLPVPGTIDRHFPWFHPSLAPHRAAGSFVSLSGRPLSSTRGRNVYLLVL